MHDAWGSIVELNNPMDFFNQPNNYWRSMLYERKLLIFKKMTFSLLDYAKFGHHFGKPWSPDDYIYSREKSIAVPDIDDTHYVTEFSNIIHSTKVIGNGIMPFHADIPNRSFKPFPHRSIWIVKNPNNMISGHTHWLNIEDGIKLLSPELQSLAQRIQVLQQSWYTMNTDEGLYDFIKIHPVTGKVSLRLNYYVTKTSPNAWIKEVYVDGIKQSDCSLIQLYIDELLKCPALFYQHIWDMNDIAIYDNYSFVHGRTALILGDALDNNERKFYRMNIDHMTNDEFLKDNVAAG